MAIEKLGPYKIDKLLGRGGMGTVYSGVHEETGDQAAIKVLSLIHSDDSNFRERFSTEIESLKKLKHKNIVSLFGYGEHDGHLFYAMELIRGPSLQQQLNEGNRFTWREVVRVGTQICRALKHAHDRGIIHRDLKPANLLVAEDETIKLSDFGIAKLFGAGQLTADGGVVGTADYMAPEQSAGLPTTTRTDLFSLGCVLYALLVGRPPFAAPTVAEAIHRLRYEDPPLLSRRVLEIPEEVEAIIMQLLEKDPPARIATALALSNRLMATLHGLSDSARRSAKSSGEVVLSADEPTAHGTSMASPPDTSARSTVVVPEDQDALRIQVEGQDQYRSLEFEPTPTGDPEPRENRFITAEEARRAETEGLNDDDQLFWVKIVGIALLIASLVGGIWMFTRPPNEAKLYERIRAAAENEDPQVLVDHDDEIDRFLELFPDSEHRDEVVQYQEELELQRMARRFERRMRRPGAEGSLTVVQRLYLQALSTSAQEPQTATDQFRALIELFEDPEADEDTRRCVQLAKAQIARLRKVTRERSRTTLEVLNDRMDRAEKIKNQDRHQAQAICRGLLELYESKTWAAQPVGRARRLLEQLQ